MIPLNLVLRELNKDYIMGNTTINNLFFMDYLKLLAKSESKVESLVNTVCTINKNMCGKIRGISFEERYST